MNENAALAGQPAQQQSETTIHQLDVQYWYRRVYALCLSRLINAADAEDATQETFVRGLARIGELRSTAAMGGWLRQIANHVCIDMIRRKKVRQTSETDVHNVADSGDSDSVTTRDQREHLLRLIHGLPDSLRETILLHYYEQMTYDEMAQWLNVARSTVNERLSKARQLLKRQLVATENAS